MVEIEKVIRDGKAARRSAYWHSEIKEILFLGFILLDTYCINK